ncbi:MAG TPA: fibronectin type III domain-containing protein, partial [Ferruginibacter sp.]|nr:fibronectin type III domain-containing protein [Ferruginibacter sp.]
VTMKTVGTAPNRTLVIQWVDYVYWGNTSPAATWQIRLYETTGVIEYVYGSMQVGATTYISNYTTGFSTGTTSGTLACVTTATNANSTASFTTNAYSANANIPNLHSTSNGSRRYYRYTPATPAANPTALNFTAITPTGMTLNWTAASPTTGTVRYAVYLSTDGGTTYNFNNSVALGTNLLAITGLLPSTTYFWRVYSVSEGAFSSTFTSGSQATAAAATYTWNNTGSGVYGTGTNWTPTRSTAASSDILIFDGATTPNPTVTGFASQTIGQIRLTNNANVNFASSATATLTVSGGSSGTDFDIQSGSTLNLNGTSSIGIAFSGTNRSVNIAGTLRTSTTGTGTVNFTNSLATVSGTLDLSSTTNSATSTTANLTIGATGTVICGSNSVVIPTATWNVASNLNITGAVAATSATGAGQSFGNVTYNCAAATGTMSFFTSGTVTIQNLTVTNTNTGRFRALTTGTLNVGNITLNGGTLEVASSTGTINVSGNVTVNGG